MTAGGLGEVETGGLVMNIVPKSGGNTMHGSVFGSGTGRRLQSSNLTQALEDQGVTAVPPLTGVYDVAATFGGPIRIGSRVVLRQRAHRGQHERQPERLLQSERRRSVQVAVCAGRCADRVLGPDLRECQRPRDVAGDAAQPGERLLGRSGHLPDLYRLHPRRARARAGVARSCRGPRPSPPPDASEVVVDSHEPCAARSELWRHVLWRRQLRARRRIPRGI